MKLKILNILFIFILVTAVFAGSSVTEDIPIDKGIAWSTSYGFDWKLDDADLENFQDTTIRFQGKDYDIHDVLVFAKHSPSLETSLTSPDDDYENNIFMEVHEDSIKYYYAFDESLKVADATMDEPLEIEFLGKNLKITSVNLNGDGFTAFVGNKYFLKCGDSVIVDGKIITLENVGSGGAIQINVDGTLEVIPSRVAEFVNGIEIFNLVTFYEDTMSERAAVLIIGNPATVTYKDGDAYIGEDKDDPNWVWNIGRLYQKEPTVISSIDDPTTGGAYIGIENNFYKVSDTDNPPGVGECISLPNNYASICFDGLTVPDDDYLTLTIKYKENVNTARSGHERGLEKVDVIYIHTPKSETLEIINKIIDSEKYFLLYGEYPVLPIKTNEIWLQVLGDENKITDVYFKDEGGTPSMKWIGSVGGGAEITKLRWKDTRDENIKLFYSKNSNTDASVFVEIVGDSIEELDYKKDNLWLKFGITNGEFSSLGKIKLEAESEELSWYNDGYYSYYNIGTKDEDHRTRYGIIIRDPKSNGASDQVVLEIPADQVQAMVTIKEEGIIHDVRINDLDVYPSTVCYGKTIDVEIELENYGTETEFNVYTKILNAELGINKQSNPFTLAPSDEVLIEETITIPYDIEEKTYPIEAIVYFDNGKEQQVKFETVLVQSCEDPDLTVNVLNPFNDSIINTDSVWLNVNTCGDTVCEYGLGHRIIIPAPPCEEGEPCQGGVGAGAASKPKKMLVTGGTSHSQLITGLKNTINDETQEEWYTIHVTCTDSLNNYNSNSVTFIVDITKEGITDYIHLSEGWNLFSIPLTLPLVELPEENPEVKPIDIRINDIKDKVEAIYSYEQGAWKVWRKDYPGTNTLTDLEAGKGCFIKMNEPATLQIEGTIGSGEPPVIPTFNVYAGWNLIGYYGTKDVSVLTALNNIDGKYSAIWTLFDNGVQSLQGTFRGLEYNEQLKRTHGYWLYTKEDGVIVPTN